LDKAKSQAKWVTVLFCLLTVTLLLSILIPAQTAKSVGIKGLTLDSNVIETNLLVNADNLLQTQSPLLERECEACGMKVTADDQWHFKVTDGNGQVHYVECFMCALNLVKRYDSLRIETFCDWYGPNCTIIIDSVDRGEHVVVNPPSALFLRTGFCEDNRVAYNQTAAETLSTDYSQFTSVFQQHGWTVEPKKVSVPESVNMCNDMIARDVRPTLTPILITPVIVVLFDVGATIYMKVRQRRTGQRLFSGYLKEF
jgi:hypothetical protein